MINPIPQNYYIDVEPWSKTENKVKEIIYSLNHLEEEIIIKRLAVCNKSALIRLQKIINTILETN